MAKETLFKETGNEVCHQNLVCILALLPSNVYTIIVLVEIFSRLKRFYELETACIVPATALIIVAPLLCYLKKGVLLFYLQSVVDTPHYLVLLDSRYDASGIPYHYLPQEDLEPAPERMQVRAPEIERYFEGFSNNFHTARPWLRKLYPKG